MFENNGYEKQVGTNKLNEIEKQFLKQNTVFSYTPRGKKRNDVYSISHDVFISLGIWCVNILKLSFARILISFNVD